MSNELQTSLKLIDSKVKFSGIAEGNPEVIIDYDPPIGTWQGYTSLQLFLISLSSCAATSILSLLRKFGKHIDDFKVNASGTRYEQHPTMFNKIVLKFEFKSDDLTDEDVEKAIARTEETICPVWAMIKGNVEVATEFLIIRN